MLVDLLTGEEKNGDDRDIDLQKTAENTMNRTCKKYGNKKDSYTQEDISGKFWDT